ncbi:uridine kinase family protein [Bacillus sp. AK031]
MDKIIQDIADWIRNQEERIIVGISGHGASGKTTFASNLVNLLGQEDVNYMNTDPFIISSAVRKKIDYEYKNENHHYKMTACHPSAHNLNAMERDILMMKDVLDFYSVGTHYAKDTLIASRKKVNIIDGMSIAFIDPDLFDLKIYLYTDGETEFSRRSIRDISERGTDLKDLQHSHHERRIQYELFMHPRSEQFDIVIKNNNEAFILKKAEVITG